MSKIQRQIFEQMEREFAKEFCPRPPTPCKWVIVPPLTAAEQKQRDDDIAKGVLPF